MPIQSQFCKALPGSNALYSTVGERQIFLARLNGKVRPLDPRSPGRAPVVEKMPSDKFAFGHATNHTAAPAMAAITNRATTRPTASPKARAFRETVGRLHMGSPRTLSLALPGRDS